MGEFAIGAGVQRRERFLPPGGLDRALAWRVGQQLIDCLGGEEVVFGDKPEVEEVVDDSATVNDLTVFGGLEFCDEVQKHECMVAQIRPQGYIIPPSRSACPPARRPMARSHESRFRTTTERQNQTVRGILHLKPPTCSPGSPTLSRLPAPTFSRRPVAAFVAITSLRLTVAALVTAASLFAVPTAASAAVPTAASAAVPTAASTQADETVDVPFEERDGIPASMVEFNGTANSANARWLVDLYAQVFARPADLNGLDHWLARISAGGASSRQSVARSFLNSTEGAQNEANLAYAELLRRDPDSQGLAFWTNFLRTGSVNTLRFQHLASDEYFQNSGNSNSAYVEKLYFDLLGRDIDREGFDFYVDLLDTGTPRWWVSRSIYESPESLGNRVTAYHQAILDRDPTSAEITLGVALILAEDERAVQAALLASDEAFDVFLLAALET